MVFGHGIAHGAEILCVDGLYERARDIDGCSGHGSSSVEAKISLFKMFSM
jgi:hypothetical protein